VSASYHLEDEAEQQAYDGRLMRRLLKYVRPYRKWMYVAAFLLLIAALVSNVTPLLMMWSVDHYINNPERTAMTAGVEGGNFSPAMHVQMEEDMKGLLFLVSMIALLTATEGFIRYAQLVIVAFVGQRTMMEMRVGLFSHLQSMSLSYLDRHPVGRLMSRVTNDTEKIQQTIVSGVVLMVSDLMTIFVVLGFMFAINWQLALIALSPVPFVFLTSILFRKYARRSFLEIRRKLAVLSAYMQENVSGMRIVQLFARERDHYDQFQRRNADHRDEWFLQIRNFAVYFPVVEFFGSLSMALIILYCGVQFLWLGGSVTGVASVGTYFGYVFWAERFFSPIRTLADRYNLILEAMASSERIFRLLDTQPEIVDSPGAQEASNIQGEIAFENVWFAYGAGEWILKDISLSIRPGERIAIVGHTGAGKSTLINLLSRFYDIQQGTIRIDGVDVKEYEQVSLRRNIGIVLQDVFLFSGSVDQNIRLGDAGMSEEYVRQCAAYVNAARFIEKLPGGYQYNVGERGCNLSTGQRQLLAFARTLAHNPRILVLDEATSSVDTETEGLIQDAIEKLMAGRTSIVIAHRLSTIQHADRIVVLHHGEIREVGTHQELLANDGLYRTLYELQYKDQDFAR
jgi:ATP-binding cassette subfamily B protein